METGYINEGKIFISSHKAKLFLVESKQTKKVFFISFAHQFEGGVN